MDLQTIITFSLAVFALAVKPGPGMMTLISRTLSFGISACLLFMVGISIVCFAYLAIVLAGLRIAEEDLVFITIALKAAAAFYLIYLGVKGLQNPDIALATSEMKEQKMFDHFLSGVMVSFSNPLVIVFYGGLVPSIVGDATLGFTDWVIMCAIVATVETGVALSYCMPLAYSRNFITPMTLRKINIASSIALIFIGLYIGYSAIPAKDILSVVGE
jgi:threonine/homoserine/homoserine lactone efflux protein